MILDFFDSYTYRGVWNEENVYQPNDIVLFIDESIDNNNEVTYSRALYLCVIENICMKPDEHPDQWDTSPYALHDFDHTSSYVLNDGVVFGGKLYYAPKAIAASQTSPPSAGSDWVLVENGKAEFLGDIRDLVSIGLTQEDLPDSVIERNIFLKASELEIIRMLKINQETFENRLTANVNGYRERMTIAIQKQTAIEIIPALAQIVENAALQERVRYQEIDWKLRVDELEEDIVSIITPDLPPDDDVGGKIFGVARRFVFDKC